MDRPLPVGAYEALKQFLGQWAGTTQWQSTPWGPARSAAAGVTFSRTGAGLAVTLSYHHSNADGTHTEGHGVFTVDPDHPDTLWYRVNSLGLPPEPPARAGWRDGTLTVERHSGHGTARHTYRIADGLLTHTAAVRLGSAGTFTPVMTSVYRRRPAGAGAAAGPDAGEGLSPGSPRGTSTA
ncbi:MULTISPECIES: DUF1579 domain-containing protein [Arthrobacter]|uniref:DUF1579 domain-containing protein n=1 Tax=Arthrobacter TaxID=1663 RepID=UPI002159965D|nr:MULTISPECIES: DUF1579 domain-containing protein [Arthrobacter]